MIPNNNQTNSQWRPVKLVRNIILEISQKEEPKSKKNNQHINMISLNYLTIMLALLNNKIIT